MKTIKVISYAKMSTLANGKIYFVMSYIATLFFLLGCIFILSYILFFNGDGDYIDVLASILFSFMLGGLLYLFHRGETNYVPKKSFKWLRTTKEGFKKITIRYLIFCVLLFVFCFYKGKEAWLFILGAVGIYFVFNDFIKSLENHEDVDCGLNKTMGKIFGTDIDEEIYGSYQNFDYTIEGRKTGDNLLVITKRRIIYAAYNGSTWMILKRQFGELNKIGFINCKSSMYEYTLALQFSDETCVRVKMDVGEKRGANPILFFKNFLNVLDAYIIDNDAVKINAN